MRAYLVPIILVLGGCSGSNVSSTTGNTESTSTSVESLINRTKEFFKAKHKSMNIEMPVSVVINEAAKEWVQEQNIRFSMPLTFSSNSCNYNEEIRKQFNLIRGSSNDSLQELMLKNKKQIVDYSKNHELSEDDKSRLKTINNILALKDINYLCARSFLINSTLPIGGWNGEIHDDKAHLELARAIYQTGLISNALQTQIISRLNDVSSWQSDRVVKNKINEIINEIVDSKDYEKILMSSLPNATNALYSFNFAGSAEPVQFSADNEYSITGSGNGITMQKSGVLWFGNNTISSKKYTLYVDSVEVASMKKQKSINSSGASNQDNSNSNDATVSN
ncbi:hypothetical protein [Acinetobacter baumannii]|uniref:hypothetical protein n=1 Tax=Acinetobacter baumannii TaxID=470 RepID=UPI0035CFE770